MMENGSNNFADMVPIMVPIMTAVFMAMIGGFIAVMYDRNKRKKDKKGRK